MRIFLRDESGKELKFDLEDANIGVRNGHACAIVRGYCRGAKDPVNLALVNVSTGERDIFELAMFAYLKRATLMGPILWAMIFSTIMMVFGVFYSQIILGRADSISMLESFWWAFFFAFLTFPVFWGLTGMWLRFTEKSRMRKERADLLAQVDARLNAARRAPTP